VLVGLMGCGKTTVGQRLAARLGLNFVDSDTEIELAARQTIAELFARYGEAEFRDGERRVIRRLFDGIPKVIATGGGAFMNDRTRELILRHGHAVWLDADVETLVVRTARRPGKRPLLHDRDARAVLADLAAVRNPIYALAHVHVRNESGRHDRAVEAIIEALRGAKRGYQPRSVRNALTSLGCPAAPPTGSVSVQTTPPLGQKNCVNSRK
jgi:shikimate kinase